MTLAELVDAINRHDIDPTSVTYEHVRNQNPDLPAARFTVYTATCAEFYTLCDEWHGKRADRQQQRDVRTLYADIGPRGLLGHVCHTLLPCWGSTPDAAPTAEPSLLDVLDELSTPSSGKNAA